MKNIKLFLFLLLSIILVLVVVQNTDPIQARFLWLTVEVPAIILLFVTAAGGFVSGLLVALLMKSREKSNV